MIPFVMKLTPSEAKLIAAIQQLQFGTILECELSTGEAPVCERELTQAQKALIEELRQNGWSRILQIKVHQGEPNYMEVPVQMQGFSSRKLLKFV